MPTTAMVPELVDTSVAEAMFTLVGILATAVTPTTSETPEQRH